MRENNFNMLINELTDTPTEEESQPIRADMEYWKKQYELAGRFPDLIALDPVATDCIPDAIRERLREAGIEEELINTVLW